MPAYEHLLVQAAALPIADRIQLIDAIWETLPTDPLPTLSDRWLAEIHRRSAEYDSGSVETTSWEIVRDEALRRIKAIPPDASSD